MAFNLDKAKGQQPSEGVRLPTMLFADKRALETNLKVNLLAIREKELNYYTQNCLAVGTQSALLAGFAYSGLTQVAIPHERAYLLKLAYLLVTTTAMCFELIAVLNTTLLSMMGPGLALRGPDGSMHPAVDGMMVEYRTAYYSFVLGLVFFHISAALFSWLIYVHWWRTHRTPDPNPYKPTLTPTVTPTLTPTITPTLPQPSPHLSPQPGLDPSPNLLTLSVPPLPKDEFVRDFVPA